jgi:SAM-dependent methyltransferase
MREEGRAASPNVPEPAAHPPAHRPGRPHAHHHDRGLAAFLRYLRLLPAMWRSEVNDAVVRELAVGPGDRVVDLGAGAGPATVAAASRGANVLAVDPMPVMRAILGLRRRLHPRGRAIDVHDGAAEAIPAADGSVDALWSVNTLHHWTDREAAVRELARVLKPGARALLVDEDADDPAHPEHERHLAERRRSRLEFDEVDEEALARALKDAGFARADGARTRLAGRPVKLVRAVR